MPSPELFKARRQWRAFIEGLLVIVCLAGGGVGAGYYLATERLRDMLAEERADHLLEIERLQTAHGRTLDLLGANIGRAANATTAAATAAATAADTAQAAARTAERAAIRSKPAGAITPEQERRAVNRAVDSANARIGAATP